MRNCSISKIFGQFKKKNKEYQYRISENRTFAHKTVQFTGLPFHKQEFVKKIDQKERKNWLKS